MHKFMASHLVRRKNGKTARFMVGFFAVVFSINMLGLPYLFYGLNVPSAVASSIGPNSGSAFANDSALGTINWSDTSDAQTSNNHYAEVDLDDNKVSRYLKATGFGFSIPNGATINGILVEVEKVAENSSRIKDNSARMVKAGVIGGDNKADLSTFWGASNTPPMSYGSATDLWEQTWSSSDINASNFGFVFAVKKNSTSGGKTKAKVDHIRITVYYTPASTTAILTLVKSVTKDNGGTAVASDWTLEADGPTDISGTSGSAAVTGAVVDPGSYDLSESGGPSGYSDSDWVCTGTGTQDDADTITLAAGQNATCTITNNDDAPSLTLNKILVKDNGGSATEGDWTLTATGPTTLSGSGVDGSTDVVSDSTFSAGTYTLSESGPDGYSAGAWTCSNDVTVNGDNQITLGLGQTTVCSITNNDDPGYIIVKKITNPADDTSFDFTADYDGDGFALANGRQNDSGPLDQGTYSVSEVENNDYTSTAVCSDGSEPDSIDLNVGETVTCTFTNTIKQAGLTIVKETNPSDTEQSFDFDLSWDEEDLTLNSGESEHYDLDPGDYSVEEVNLPADWDLTSSTCEDQDDNVFSPSSITLAPDGSVVCTFTNTQHGHLIVSKVTDPEDSETEFSITVEGTGEIYGDAEQTIVGGDSVNYEVAPGTYSVSEGDLSAGWSMGSNTCDNVTVGAGETKECTINNIYTEPPATITGYKWSDLNSDGVWQNDEESVEPGVEGWAIVLGKVGEPAEGSTTVPIEIVAMSLTGANGQFFLSASEAGNYKICEENKSNWVATNPQPPAIDSFFDIEYRIDPGDHQFTCDSFFDVFVDLETKEISQDDDENPLNFGNHQLAVISGENSQDISETSATITWETDKPATSRVVYDTVSHTVLGSAPNYDYAFSSAEQDTSPKVTSHSVVLTGLTAGTTYYYRVISAASPESVGGEGSVSTSSSSGGGGGGGGGSVAPTPTPQVAGATDETPEQVLGASTLPETSLTGFDNILMSFFSTLMMTGVMMLLIGYGMVPKKLEKYIY